MSRTSDRKHERSRQLCSTDPMTEVSSQYTSLTFFHLYWTFLGYKFLTLSLSHQSGWFVTFQAWTLPDLYLLGPSRFWNTRKRSEFFRIYECIFLYSIWWRSAVMSTVGVSASSTLHYTKTAVPPPLLDKSRNLPMRISCPLTEIFLEVQQRPGCS